MGKLLQKITLLLMLGAFAACSDDSVDEAATLPPEKKERTVIVYQCAQNSLGVRKDGLGYHHGDSAELVAGARYLGEGDRLLLYVDDDALPRIYLIDRTTLVPTCVYRADTDLDSADPATLQHVVEWCAAHYPAEHYGLVMWSHASGWLPSRDKSYTAPTVTTFSFGNDVGEGGNMASDRKADGSPSTEMEIDDMADALAGSGVHFDYIFFDACLMQCMEVDYALRHATDYIVAGPVDFPAIGADYTQLMKNGLFGDDPTVIADTYYNYMENEAPSPYDVYGLVISVVKTSELDSLASLTAEVLADFDGNYPDLSGTQRYLDYRASWGYMPEFYDAGEAMRQVVVSDEAYERWRAQFDRCVIYKAATNSVFSYNDWWTNYYITIDQERFTGVSMFVPQRRYTTNARSSSFGDLNEAFRETEWYRAAGWESKGW